MKNCQIISLLALIGAGSAMAAPPSPQKGERRPPPASPLFAALDTDHDRKLSTEEVSAAPEVLAKLDKNGDGDITPDELQGPPPPEPKDEGEDEKGKDKDKDEPKGPPPGKRMPPPPVVAVLDADRDGTISAGEMENAPDSLKELDKNGDGELSQEELRPHGPPPPGSRTGEGRKRPPRRPGGDEEEGPE